MLRLAPLSPLRISEEHSKHQRVLRQRARCSPTAELSEDGQVAVIRALLSRSAPSVPPLVLPLSPWEQSGGGGHPGVQGLGPESVHSFFQS